MNKGIIGGLIAVVVVLGGAYYFWSKGGMPGKEPEDPSRTFAQLAANKTPQECSFVSPNGSSGVLFVSGGMIRGDFSASLGGATTSGHMIMRDNTSYIWADGMTQGYKNAFADATSTSQSPTAGPDDRVTPTCKPWTPDESKFELPGNVTFNTVTSVQMQDAAAAAAAAASANSGLTPANTCSQCDMIPNDEAKRQCRAALNC